MPNNQVATTPKYINLTETKSIHSIRASVAEIGKNDPIFFAFTAICENFNHFK